MRIRKYFSDTDEVYSLGAGYRQLHQILVRAYTRGHDGRILLCEDSLPVLSLLNCVRTVIEVLARRKESTLDAFHFLEQIPVRRRYRNILPDGREMVEYEIFPRSSEERAAIIFSIGHILAGMCPEQVDCLNYLREMALEEDPDGAVAWYFLNVPAGVTGGHPEPAPQPKDQPRKGEIATTAQQTLFTVYLLNGMGVNFRNSDKASWIRFLHWFTGKNAQDIKEKLYYDADSKKTLRDLKAIIDNADELFPKVVHQIKNDIQG